MALSPDMITLEQNKSNLTPIVDSATEEFRKYLESSGVLEVMTGIFKVMYEKEDKPSDPLTYFITTLGAVNYYVREVEALKDEIQDLKSVIKNLEKENKVLREKSEKCSSD